MNTNDSPSRRVTVVGAGVIGLTSALRLAEAGHRVRVVAREFSPQTTSDVAPGVWFPFHAAPKDRVLGWAGVAYDRFKDLAQSEPDAGVRMVEGIELLPEVMTGPGLRDLILGARAARPDEIPAPYVDGTVFSVQVAAMIRFMPWLRDKVEALGVSIEQRNVFAIAPLFADADVVVNCTGLGSRELVADVDLHPVRGQIVMVERGSQTGFVQATAGPGPMCYIIPRPDDIVLGGTVEPDAWDLTPDPAVEEAIRARAAAIVPALGAAAVVSRAVGLRPARSVIRLEAENVPGGCVIHNYGHGGAGVTVSWGCAAEVVAILAREV